MSETKKPFRMEPPWIIWSMGWVLYTIASEFVTLQSVVDILDRLALVGFATGTALAWRSGHRGSAWLFGLLTIGRAALGAPLVEPRSATQMWINGVLVGLIVLTILVSFWSSRRRGTEQGLAR
jgi:hypothetical protein